MGWWCIIFYHFIHIQCCCKNWLFVKVYLLYMHVVQILTFGPSISPLCLIHFVCLITLQWHVFCFTSYWSVVPSKLTHNCLSSFRGKMDYLLHIGSLLSLFLPGKMDIFHTVTAVLCIVLNYLQVLVFTSYNWSCAPAGKIAHKIHCYFLWLLPSSSVYHMFLLVLWLLFWGMVLLLSSVGREEVMFFVCVLGGWYSGHH